MQEEGHHLVCILANRQFNLCNEYYDACSAFPLFHCCYRMTSHLGVIQRHALTIDKPLFLHGNSLREAV